MEKLTMRVICIPNIRFTQYGTILLLLKHTNIELTLDGSVYVNDRVNSIRLVISKNGKSIAMIHPKGNVVASNKNVEIQANHRNGIRYAKMWEKGLSFTTDRRAVTFLLDAGGVKTTIDKFLILNPDIINNTFYSDSHHGPFFIKHAKHLINTAKYWVTKWGVNNWKIGNIRVTETVDGSIRLFECNNNYKMVIKSGTLLIKTIFLHCTASAGANGHIFVRRDFTRVHYDGQIFVLRHEGQSAGIDEYNDIHVY